MTSILLTGKSSGYLVSEGSHYWIRQLDYETVSPVGLAKDLQVVMDALNDVEGWLGISLTTWTSTLGKPEGAEHLHYSVRIGGSASNLGTFREAIDRLRDAGNVPAWTWYFAPTKDEWNTKFHSRRNCLSSLTVYEYLIAIGRIVGAGAYGDLSRTRITVTHNPFVPQPDGSYEEQYQLSGGGRFNLLQPGEYLSENVFDFKNFWQTGGSLSREQSVRRRQVPVVPIDETDSSPNIVEVSNYTEAGLENQGQSGAFGQAQAILDMPIYKVLGAGDSDTSLEAIEEAHEDKWTYYDRNGNPSPVPTDDLELSSIRQPTDISYIAGACTSIGTVKGLYKRFPQSDGSSEYRVIYDGDWETSVVYDGLAATPQVDEFGGLNLREVWGTSNLPGGYARGVLGRSGFPINLNSPMWEHNEENRDAFPFIDWINPAPEAVNHTRIDSSKREEAEHIGDGDWRTSNESPFTGCGYPYDSDDPDDEKTIEEVVSILLSRLRGIAGSGGGPGGSATFDPATQGPQQYFWCFPSFPFASGAGSIPKLSQALRPNAGGNQDGIPFDVANQWRIVRSYRGWEEGKNTLDPNEEAFGQEVRANVIGEGFISALRQADITVPDSDGGRGRWLVWESPGSNGDSPFEEVVNRF